MKDINIVVVNYKMLQHIKTCFATLFDDINESGLKVQVTVVDNSENADGIKEYLQESFPQVQYIDAGGNIGFGKAQNKGLKATEATYYFALNPDTTFHAGADTLKKLFNYMEQHPKVGMIGPKVVYPDGELQYSCWRFPTFLQPVYSRTKLGKKGKGKKIADAYFMKEFDHNSTRPVDAIMGSAMFVRGTAYKEIGGFDDRFFMYFEDIDWSLRMWEAHWPVYYTHDIVLTHIHGKGSAKVPGVINALLKNKLARIHFKSWLQYMWKWRGNNKYYKIRP